MPAKSVSQSSASVPFVKFDLYVSYKQMEGVFEIVDNSKKKEVSADCGGDKAKVDARKSEWLKSAKELRMVVASVRQKFTAEDGNFDLFSQDVDNTKEDLVALRADFRSAPAYVGKFSELFGKYSQVNRRFEGGKLPKFKSATIFVGYVDGRPAKLELTGNAVKYWREESKEKSLSEVYALAFKAEEGIVKVGQGSKSRDIHPLTVDATPETKEERKSADDMAEAVKSERSAYQAQLRGEAGEPAAATSSDAKEVFDGNKDDAGTEEVPF